MKKNWKPRRPLFSSPVPASVKKPKIRWKIIPILWMAFQRTSFVIGALVIFSSVLGMWAAGRLASTASFPALPSEMVLAINLDSGFAETLGGFSDPFAPPVFTIHEVVDTLDDARNDSRVKGLVARLDGGQYELAHIEELHAALARFHDAGKFSYIYSPSYGDVGGLGAYYLASGFQEIWMQPMGIVAIPGISFEMPFLRGTLDKIGVMPEFYQRKEYKSVYENFTSPAMSPANREALQSIVQDTSKTIISAMAQGRALSESKLKSLIDRGIFTTETALEERLIDRAAYADDLLRLLKEKVKNDAEADDSMFVHLLDYQPPPHLTMLPKPKIALIHAVGAIVESDVSARAHSSVFIEEGIAAASEIVPAIQDAADDPSIKAIVLRVDSPGGSPVASESILHALKTAQAKGKPVIVSMGAAAASGGYWIVSSADYIFASPATLTGSIGVVGGKASAAALWEKIGVNWDSVDWGENSGLWSINTPFTPSEKTQIDAMLDAVYEGFVERVAAGRKLSPAEVEKIARGRVWSGARAAEIGLVDALGGLSDAIDYTAKSIGVEAGRGGVDVIVLPHPKSPFEELFDLFSQYGLVLEGAKLQSYVLNALRPLISTLAPAVIPASALVYDPLTH